MKITESRNKREGSYRGWVHGRFIRSHDAYKVSSWLAFRVWNDRWHQR